MSNRNFCCEISEKKTMDKLKIFQSQLCDHVASSIQSDHELDLKVLNPFLNDKFQTLPIQKGLQTTILALLKTAESSSNG